MSLQVNSTQQERINSVHDLIRARMDEHHIPGLSLAVLQKGQPLLLQGYGYANLEHNVPATADTLYELASVSKQFVATATMLLVEEGKLTIDDPISGYFRNSPMIWQPITIRHLLTHTSGLVRDGIADYWLNPDAMHLDYDYPRMYEIIAGRELDFVTGEKCSYSNSGYFLLGLILEQITGQTLNEVLTARIFAPLGMSATRINDPLAILPRRASGYAPTEATAEQNHGQNYWRKTPYIGLRHHFANGGLVSTVADLAKWDAALYTDQFLPQVRLQEMWTPYILNDGTPTDRGLGWVISDFEGHRQIHHGGLLPGFAANISRFIDDGITVIVLTNSQFDWTANVPAVLAKEVAKLYFEILP
jgi:CubicO group peptidase (beta-lactamase class C family)